MRPNAQFSLVRVEKSRARSNAKHDRNSLTLFDASNTFSQLTCIRIFGHLAGNVLMNLLVEKLERSHRETAISWPSIRVSILNYFFSRQKFIQISLVGHKSLSFFLFLSVACVPVFWPHTNDTSLYRTHSHRSFSPELEKFEFQMETFYAITECLVFCCLRSTLWIVSYFLFHRIRFRFLEIASNCFDWRFYVNFMRVFFSFYLSILMFVFLNEFQSRDLRSESFRNIGSIK